MSRREFWYIFVLGRQLHEPQLRTSDRHNEWNRCLVHLAQVVALLLIHRVLRSRITWSPHTHTHTRFPFCLIPLHKPIAVKGFVNKSQQKQVWIHPSSISRTSSGHHVSGRKPIRLESTHSFLEASWTVSWTFSRQQGSLGELSSDNRSEVCGHWDQEKNVSLFKIPSWDNLWSMALNKFLIDQKLTRQNTWWMFFGWFVCCQAQRRTIKGSILLNNNFLGLLWTGFFFK